MMISSHRRNACPGIYEFQTHLTHFFCDIGRMDKCNLQVVNNKKHSLTNNFLLHLAMKTYSMTNALPSDLLANEVLL